jgi:hypothetical protein
MTLDSKYNKPPTNPLFRKCIDTPLDRNHMAYYLREGWKKLYDEYPSNKSLSILWAQTVLETGGKFLRNWNWGNIKKREGLEFTSYYCTEVINGKVYKFHPYHPETYFAAWPGPVEGAAGYISFLANRSRYRKAWDALVEGDPRLYCIELKNGGYFTAPLSHYMSIVLKLVDEFNRKSDILLSWEPPKEVEDIEEDIIVEAPEEDNTISDAEEEMEQDPYEPQTDATDLIPIADDEEKLNIISMIFFAIWGYILQFIALFKGVDR